MVEGMHFVVAEVGVVLHFSDFDWRKLKLRSENNQRLHLRRLL
ncbi:hypothetical protein M8C21_014268 [Ambrosia artemisiifolia]|uniref:Uncharacterized protein n=1 Tax=Ambrosia artemisiifolia TaxID=4212 RepID=A0AAD5GQQ8_AMBAR|nr:hypothetical protein M8C21_014268 [Ambrosia artemisiifolia]